jgi:hypothetical protein
MKSSGSSSTNSRSSNISSSRSSSSSNSGNINSSSFNSSSSSNIASSSLFPDRSPTAPSTEAGRAPPLFLWYHAQSTMHWCQYHALLVTFQSHDSRSKTTLFIYRIMFLRGSSKCFLVLCWHLLAILTICDFWVLNLESCRSKQAR